MAEVALAPVQGARPASAMTPASQAALSEAMQRLFGHLADLPCELFGFALLSPEWRLLSFRHSRPGNASTAPVPLAGMVGEAAALGARWVVIVHNHPGGDPSPSGQDIRVTRRIARALAGLGALLADHLVLARGACLSFRAQGLI